METIPSLLTTVSCYVGHMRCCIWKCFKPQGISLIEKNYYCYYETKNSAGRISRVINYEFSICFSTESLFKEHCMPHKNKVDTLIIVFLFPTACCMTSVFKENNSPDHLWKKHSDTGLKLYNTSASADFFHSKQCLYPRS